MRFAVYSVSIICVVFIIQIGSTSAQDVEFDETRAWSYLLGQCELGPRPPGSKAHQKCLEYLQSELTKFCDTVHLQAFMGENRASGEVYNLHNIIGKLGPIRSRRVLLCAHWDTRPWADHDPDSERRQDPIIGANDGASGVAVLLELARCLSLKDPGIGVDIVLFDGEDMGREGHLDEYCLGSKWYAENMSYPYPEAVILLDMVGDAQLHISQELYSRMTSPGLLNEIFAVAVQLGESAFDPHGGVGVYDDHIAFIEAGIEAVNIIDFDYEFWHTLADDVDQCSVESLGSVGRVILAWIYKRGEQR
ncbi:hypothetical protein CEE37_05440 [candidate division LCP-89 bacterium B3_LCP]|uniref:Peptidase M28 domain-containing protein n=1 Tax=candidate division LCP-89 bacterium B3_LCP TaxID=2012998 RepID=A0A532V1W5_UNCL8|nr:MAG: hypothetical protein CEE37_05440 [candidate division LCP-89 bacterium B3_LCP]